MGSLLNSLQSLWPWSNERNLPRVETQAIYYKPSDTHKKEKPYVCEFHVGAVSDAKTTNMEYLERAISVSDIRGFEQCFTVGRNGFEIIHHQSSLSLYDFESPSEIKMRYLSECCDIVRSHFNASEVVVLDNWVVGRLLESLANDQVLVLKCYSFEITREK